ncbi:polyketide cyclase [Pedobacter sp. HMWF019]|uniref:nuclear transport factor 2 family protein n=1 Tax=Pedobacter sp. HMWF019 TaxID=2056856 RepID=UPI000D39F596|nr:ester cyclase [Pedobacter sp. HMWF019]PTS91688.1 polyketide cyclase [Pedobacter sp. HMWF019]
MKNKNKLDGYEHLVKPHWSADELNNLKIVTGFLQTLRSLEFDSLLTEYGSHPYIQHNIGMENGVQGVVKEGRKALKQFPEFSIEAKHVYVDGEFVIIHSHMTAKAAHHGIDSRGLNVIDIWKVSDGKIVEHWDSIQPLDFGGRLFSLFTGGTVKNGNGRF